MAYKLPLMMRGLGALSRLQRLGVVVHKVAAAACITCRSSAEDGGMARPWTRAMSSERQACDCNSKDSHQMQLKAALAS